MGRQSGGSAALELERSGHLTMPLSPVVFVVALPRFLFLKMEKVLVGCFLLILGQIFLLLPAEARQRPPARSISRGRHTRTRPQTVLLGESWGLHLQKPEVAEADLQAGD